MKTTNKEVKKMTMITFRTDNDKGEMVNKTATLSWVKNTIKNDFLNKTGKQIGAFTVSVREQEDRPGFLTEIVVQNKKGQSMLYHYGGFDGFEVIEPHDFDNWFRQKEEA